MSDTYEYMDFRIRGYMIESLEAYVNGHRPTGSFLQAVISNDFLGACEKADHENLYNLPAFAAWLFNEGPRACWGSPEAYAAWVSPAKTGDQQ